ncbi:unnamed protein product [Blepharisma stoltei]|uniref:Uncharacterized protein n=1 Tax=Blepharisma stoltei TaxID=1481888 RepID=A0AAU9JX53_9CILI|nr:unnamed protein product [Blepharisma stoltei]
MNKEAYENLYIAIKAQNDKLRQEYKSTKQAFLEIQTKLKHQERHQLRIPTSRDLTPKAKGRLIDNAHRQIEIYEKDFQMLSHKLKHFSTEEVEKLEDIVKSKEDRFKELADINKNLKSQEVKTRVTESMSKKEIMRLEKECQQKKLDYMNWIKTLEYKLLENAKLIKESGQRLRDLTSKYYDLKMHNRSASVSPTVSVKNRSLERLVNRTIIESNNSKFSSNQKIKELELDLKQLQEHEANLAQKVKDKEQECKLLAIKLQETQEMRSYTPIPDLHTPDISVIYSPSANSLN